MYKKLLLVLAAVVMAVTIASCTIGPTTSETPVTTTTTVMMTTTTTEPLIVETTENPYPISVDAEYVLAAYDKFAERIVEDPEAAVEVALGILASRDLYDTNGIMMLRAIFYDEETITLLPLDAYRISILIGLYNQILRDILD